jgi:hypothetical protein
VVLTPTLNERCLRRVGTYWAADPDGLAAREGCRPLDVGWPEASNGVLELVAEDASLARRQLEDDLLDPPP